MKILLKLIANFLILLLWGLKSLLRLKKPKPSKREEYARIKIRGALPWVNDPAPWYAMFKTPPLSVEELAEDIKALALSPVYGVVFEIHFVEASRDRIEAVISVINLIKKRGKKTAAILIGRGNAEYLIASACETVVAAPGTGLMLTGVSGEAVYFREVLERLGVTAQFFHAGKYKAAAERFTRSAPSEEDAEQMDEIVKGLLDFFVKRVSEGRGLSQEAVIEAIEDSPMGLKAALEKGLLDKISPLDNLSETLSKGEDSKKPKIISISNYGGFPPEPPRFYPLRKRKRLALLKLRGPIIEERVASRTDHSRTIALGRSLKVLKEVVEDRHISGVVLWINSPGGGALASEVIFDRVLHLRNKKPVVAFIDGVGASGGYFIASGANKIVCGRNSIVGSIGVIAGKMSFGGLAEKLSVRHHRFSAGGNGDLHGIFEPLGEKSSRLLEREVGEIYEQFIARVAEGRGKSREEIAAAAEGRVWLGEGALKTGLIDELGVLRTALDRAASLAGLPPQEMEDVDFFAATPGFREYLMGGTAISMLNYPPAYEAFLLEELLRRDAVIMYCPFSAGFYANEGEENPWR